MTQPDLIAEDETEAAIEESGQGCGCDIELNSASKGAIAELAFANLALERGWIPFFPVHPCCPVDVLLWHPRATRKVGVQVKKGTLYKVGNYQYMKARVRSRSNGRVNSDTCIVRRYKSEYDILAVYNSTTKGWVIHKGSIGLGKKSMSIKIVQQGVTGWELIESAGGLCG